MTKNERKWISFFLLSISAISTSGAAVTDPRQAVEVGTTVAGGATAASLATGLYGHRSHQLAHQERLAANLQARDAVITEATSIYQRRLANIETELREGERMRALTPQDKQNLLARATNTKKKIAAAEEYVKSGKASLSLSREDIAHLERFYDQFHSLRDVGATATAASEKLASHSRLLGRIAVITNVLALVAAGTAAWNASELAKQSDLKVKAQSAPPTAPATSLSAESSGPATLSAH